MKYAQLVIGPAGSGKSTYCSIIQKHCEVLGRSCHIINLDPAAEDFRYTCSIDIRELISLDDVMEELHLGPNGGQIFAMEYFIQNLDWLEEKLEIGYGDHQYILFDCPGQIELFTHLPIMKILIESLKNWDFRVCGIYCLDVGFLTDASKFVAGSVAALSAMIQLEIFHVNVLTKCDLVEDEQLIYTILQKDAISLVTDLEKTMPIHIKPLNMALANLLEDYSMVSYVCLKPDDEDSIGQVLLAIDMNFQYYDDKEPNTNFDLADITGNDDFE
ncbi:ATP-binding domain 1 family protein [Cryptosporidium andersoni]|uniref:GPN-loop GTPase 3 n=1 Tax=Cryptosporidium andersoni TaxID=117008 RepID=A0A1J4MJ81_9CRYT|nr:ATP-binding domain 1 family protein [Cryptosporidium andersoni]